VVLVGVVRARQCLERRSRIGYMAKNNILPPVYRDCQRLLLHTENTVMRFSRYHKYTVGTDLRKQAMMLMRTVHRAVYDRAQQSQHIHSLLWQVDDFKLTLQLASDIGAFVQGSTTAAKPVGAGFAAFETAAQLAVAIGKQCGGWQKKVQPAMAPHAQSGTGLDSAAAGLSPVASSHGWQQDRPISLSARAASRPGLGQEAKP
jgi:hypothetical protein